MAWRHYICEILGKPASVLIDERFARQFPVKDLSRLSWFGVYCKHPIGEALWNPEETDALDRIEEDLISLSQKFGHGWAVYVLTIATPGIREYYLYHADQADLSGAFSALRAEHSDYRIEFETANDPEWEQYRRYISYDAGGTP